MDDELFTRRVAWQLFQLNATDEEWQLVRQAGVFLRREMSAGKKPPGFRNPIRFGSLTTYQYRQGRFRIIYQVEHGKLTIVSVTE